MKKYLSLIVMAVAAVIFLASCGASQYLTNNTNLQQTNVVLSQKNFHVVKNVESEASATYVFGIGGCSKESLKCNAVANLTKKANLSSTRNPARSAALRIFPSLLRDWYLCEEQAQMQAKSL